MIGSKSKLLGEIVKNVFFLWQREKIKGICHRAIAKPLRYELDGGVRLDGSSTNTEKLKRELRANFPEIFSEGLVFCSKVKAKFELKEDATP